MDGVVNFNAGSGVTAPIPNFGRRTWDIILQWLSGIAVRINCNNNEFYKDRFSEDGYCWLCRRQALLAKSGCATAKTRPRSAVRG